MDIAKIIYMLGHTKTNEKWSEQNRTALKRFQFSQIAQASSIRLGPWYRHPSFWLGRWSWRGLPSRGIGLGWGCLRLLGLSLGGLGGCRLLVSLPHQFCPQWVRWYVPNQGSKYAQPEETISMGHDFWHKLALPLSLLLVSIRVKGNIFVVAKY